MANLHAKLPQLHMMKANSLSAVDLHNNYILAGLNKKTHVSFACKCFCMCTHTQCTKSGLGSILVV